MKKIILSFLCILSLGNPLLATIQEASRLEQFIPALQKADKQTLVVFDIDLVLMQPKESAFQMPNMKRYSCVCKDIVQLLGSSKRDTLLTLMALQTEPILVDPKMPQVVSQLQERGVPTIALTANMTGKFGSVEKLEVWKIGKLNALGYDFTKTAPHKAPIEFCDLPKHRNHCAVYREGVLFTNAPTCCSKGQLLLKFFEVAGIEPQKVIFIDDRQDNVESVESALEGKNIDYLGIVYTGALHYPSRKVDQKEFEEKWSKLAAEAQLECYE